MSPHNSLEDTQVFFSCLGYASVEKVENRWFKGLTFVLCLSLFLINLALSNVKKGKQKVSFNFMHKNNEGNI